MRLLKMALEPKDRLVLQAGCQHSWPCWGKPAVVFHDRGKIFTRRSGAAGAGRSARHHYRASATLLSFGERCGCILHSLRMVSVFFDSYEHSSQGRAHQAAKTERSLDHSSDT